MNYSLLKKLCLAFAPSGYEREVRNIITEEIKAYVTDYNIDNTGNIIAFKKGKNAADKKVVYAAHMDEVGFMVTSSEKDGYAKFKSIGATEAATLGKRVTILPYAADNEPVPDKIDAIIGAKPIHLLSGDERNKIRSFDKMYFDYGVTSKKDDKKEKDGGKDDKDGKDDETNKNSDGSGKKEEVKLINTGDYAVYYSDFTEFGEDKVKISSKAIDDRFGCAVLCEIIKSELEYDTYFAFTVCEEVGMRGAAAAASVIGADVAVIIEATTANDIYDKDKNNITVCKQGQGAVLPFADNATIYNKDLFNLALKTASEKNISVQIKQFVAGGTDAGAFQKAECGAEVLGIALPARYIHSAVNVGDKRDMEACLNLASVMIKAINEM